MATTRTSSPATHSASSAAAAANWTVGLVVGLGLVVVTPMFLTGVQLRDLSHLDVVLALLITTWSGTRLALLLARDRVELATGVAWIFVYVWFGVSALAQIVANRFPIANQTFPDEMQASALGTILVGLAGFEIGHWIRRSRGARSQPALFERPVVPRRIWVLAAFGFLGTLYGLAKLGSLLFSSRFSAQAAIQGGVVQGQRLDQYGNHAQSFVQVAFIWVPAFLSLYLLLSMRRARRGGARVPKRLIASDNATLLLVGLAICVAITANPIGNPRYRFAGVGFALICAMWPMVTARRFKLAIAGLLASMFILYPLGNAFRYDQRNFKLPSVRTVITDTADFGMYQQEVNAQLYVRAHGHTYGRQLLGVSLVFVPRALWPGKPTATGNLISPSTRINASASVWAVAYVDGGWPLVLLLFVGYGWLIAALDDAFWRARGERTRFISLAVPLFAAFQTFLLRGDPLPAFGELVPLFGLLFLTTRAARVRGDAVAPLASSLRPEAVSAGRAAGGR